MNPPPYSEKEPPSTPVLNHPAGPPYPMDNTAPSAMPPPYQLFCNSPGVGPSQDLFVQPQQAIIITPVQPTNEPDFLAYSIFTMLCCFLPLGIAALVFSIQTRQANKIGDRTAARRHSMLARSFAHIALGVGILLTFVYITVLAVLLSRVDSYYP
ncbi:tumor suppressor candidate 5 homolog [Python bivittatus]|uniref:Tumor suppressor candidate 5 homolog n=1 Tax=Python bivittatus TaxID=176946 RepID=A0A9F3QVV5_PYTBI|nr:tumor suppressor candidate 5 homolog [Python bivittatus]